MLENMVNKHPILNDLMLEESVPFDIRGYEKELPKNIQTSTDNMFIGKDKTILHLQYFVL